MYNKQHLIFTVVYFISRHHMINYLIFQALLIAVYVVATFKKVEEDEDEDFIDIEPTFDNSNEKIKVKFYYFPILYNDKSF
jgi:Ca2+/Na+ antiporter